MYILWRLHGPAYIQIMHRTLILSIGLTACTQFPALEGTISDAAREAPYPKLTPIPPYPDSQIDSEQAALQQRLLNLNARADRLRQTEIGALR